MNPDSAGGNHFMGLVMLVALIGCGLFQKTGQLTAGIRYSAASGALVGIPRAEAPHTAFGNLITEKLEATWREWSEEGKTGPKRRPGQEAVLQLIANRGIPWMNAAARFWPILLLLSLVGLAVGIKGMVRGVPELWIIGTWAGYALVVNLGLLGTLPRLGPPTLQNGFLLFAAAQAAVGFITLLGILVSRDSGGSRTLKYGPPFLLPRTTKEAKAKREDGIVAGTVDETILPAHTGWNAKERGDIVIPFDRISCSATVLGEKGSGKSRLLFGFHDAIRQRYPKVPILIHDPKGEWFRTYYNPDTDLIFAPHFEGSTYWSIWNEFRKSPQLCHELISTAVYAHDAKGDTFWMDSAIRILRSVAHLKTLQAAKMQLNLMKKGNAVDKTWLSMFQVAQLGLEDIVKCELPPPCAEGDAPLSMSIDQYLEWPGRIFLLNDPSCATEQKGAFSLFLSAFMLKALSRPDVRSGELQAVAIVDEALTFNLPPDVDRRIYALCRSKGLSIIAGAQRLPDRYQHERGEWATAEFIFGMKVISQDTQNSLSRRAGQMHFNQPRMGRSLSQGRVSITENEQAERIEAIPAEHFGRLAPRQFVLFHDRGLVTGKTASVDHVQQDRPMPKYNPRRDVARFTQGVVAAEETDDEPESGSTNDEGIDL